MAYDGWLNRLLDAERALVDRISSFFGRPRDEPMTDAEAEAALAEARREDTAGRWLDSVKGNPYDTDARPRSRGPGVEDPPRHRLADQPYRIRGDERHGSDASAEAPVPGTQPHQPAEPQPEFAPPSPFDPKPHEAPEPFDPQAISPEAEHPQVPSEPGGGLGSGWDEDWARGLAPLTESSLTAPSGAAPEHSHPGTPATSGIGPPPGSGPVPVGPPPSPFGHPGAEDAPGVGVPPSGGAAPVGPPPSPFAEPIYDDHGKLLNPMTDAEYEQVMASAAQAQSPSDPGVPVDTEDSYTGVPNTSDEFLSDDAGLA